MYRHIDNIPIVEMHRNALPKHMQGLYQTRSSQGLGPRNSGMNCVGPGIIEITSDASHRNRTAFAGRCS